MVPLNSNDLMLKIMRNFLYLRSVPLESTFPEDVSARQEVVSLLRELSALIESGADVPNVDLAIPAGYHFFPKKFDVEMLKEDFDRLVAKANRLLQSK